MPGRRCTVCDHPKVNEINTLLVRQGASYREIAARYTLKSSSLYRHRSEHIPERIAKAANVREMLAANDLLGQAQLIQEQTYNLLSLATQVIVVRPPNPATNDPGERRVADPAMALRAIREARENTRLLGEVIGKLKPAGSPTFNVSAVAGVVAKMALPDNGRGPGAREAAMRRLQELGELPPILQKQLSAMKGGNGNGNGNGSGD
jgi:transposase-like protein